MAYTLANIEALKNDPVSALVIKAMSQDNAIMQRIPWVHTVDRVYTYAEDGSAPNVGFRGINRGYQKSTGDYKQETINLRIMGADAEIDQFLLDTQAGSVEELRAGAIRKASTQLGLLFNEAFINGDSAANANDPSFDGIAKLVKAESVVEAGENGLEVNTDATREDFLDKLTELTNATDGKPDMLLMNRQVLAAIKSSARRLNVLGEGVDDFGRTVDTFDGVALIDAGNGPSGAQIIGNAEVQGTADDASSIYAVKFGPDAVHAVGTGAYFNVRHLGESVEMPQQVTRVDGYAAVVAKGNNVAVLKGVIA